MGGVYASKANKILIEGLAQIVEVSPDNGPALLVELIVEAIRAR